VAFQRKKPLAFGVKAPYPGFIEPALATSIEKVPATKASRPSPVVAMTGPNASRKSRMTLS
jgi:hypothetical protein